MNEMKTLYGATCMYHCDQLKVTHPSPMQSASNITPKLVGINEISLQPCLRWHDCSTPFLWGN